jgi:predicted secreted protein
MRTNRPIMILKQGGGTLAAVSGDGASALQCQLHALAGLSEESVTGRWCEIIAGV